MSDTPGKASESGNDNRRARRFTVDVEASVKTSFGSVVRSRTRDVSQTGICLISQDAVPVQDLLDIDLVLAFGNNSYSEPLSLKSRAVWCTPIAEVFQIGAMFEGVTDEQDNFLEMFLQFLDGTLAPKGVDGYSESSSDDDEEEDAADKDNPFAS
ncbi:MAG: PilZ domain-containing protein [Deltaproteobacteria bacterium]|nr:PilZ domain-containing protein [Deltaproteobacteria bacterium]